MFPLNDPQFHLDLHHQRSAEWRREAAADHLAREASRGGPRRNAWWSRSARPLRPVRAPAAL